MARRSEHSQEQIKEMVLKAAETIVIEDGVQALTVRKIAQDIGYTVGSIYMVFANRQDLTMHIKGRTLDDLAARLKEVPTADRVEVQIRLLANAYLQYACENFNRWHNVFEPTSLENDNLPAWYRQKIESVFAPIENLFKQLKPQSSSEEASLAARSLWCGVHGVCVLSLNGSLGRAGVVNTENAVSLLVDHFLQGWKL